MTKLDALNEAKAIQAEVAQCLEVVADIGRKVDLSTVAKHLDRVTRKLDVVLSSLSEGAKAETRSKLEESVESSQAATDKPTAKGRGRKGQ